MVSASIFGGKVRYGIMFLYLFLLPHKTYSQYQPQPCFSSSCGKISNITHPFRLKADPDHCGDSRYELDCVNNVTVLKLFGGEYFVESINYNNYTIRVVDPNIQPNNCSSLPRFILSPYNFTHYHSYDVNYMYKVRLNSMNAADYENSDLSKPVIYMKCTSPPSKVVDRYYADTASCVDQYTYVIVGDPPFGILEPQCRVKRITLTSFWGPTTTSRDPSTTSNNTIGNVSYIDIHKALDYGFEISWLQAYCSCGDLLDQCHLMEPAGEIQCDYTIG